LADGKKAYYRTNKKKIRAYKKKYRAANRDKLRVASKKYHESNREKIQTKVGEWQAENVDRVNGYKRKYAEAHRSDKRAYNRAYRETFPDRSAEQQRQYAQANKEKRRVWYNNYRARAIEAAGFATPEQIQARWDYYGGKCYICGAEAEATDHVKPLGKGGAQWPCNQRPICNKCNSMKGAKWPYDFSAEVNGALGRR